MSFTNREEERGNGPKYPVGTLVYVWNAVKSWITGEVLGVYPSVGSERFEVLVDGLPGVYDANHVHVACPRARTGVADMIGTRSKCTCNACRSSFPPMFGLEIPHEAAFLDNLRVRYVPYVVSCGRDYPRP
jgi:hypothetical protein